LGVVGLPDLVGLGGFAAVHQLEHLPVALGSLMRERDERGIEPPGDGIHGGIAWDRPALVLGDLGGLTVDSGQARRRAPQRQPFDQQHQLGGQPPPALVGPGRAGEPRQTVGAVAGQPPLRGPQRHPCRRSDADQRDAVLEVGFEEREARQRGGALRLGQPSKRRCPAGDGRRQRHGCAAVVEIGQRLGAGKLGHRYTPSGRSQRGAWIVALTRLDTPVPAEPAMPATSPRGYRSST
jgi:hypothetical protein